MSEQTTQPTLLENQNFQYCVQFVRNGGDRLRAIRLVMDCTGIGAIAATHWVDDLSFKPLHDERRKQDQERLHHMEQHSTDIYG